MFPPRSAIGAGDTRMATHPVRRAANANQITWWHSSCKGLRELALSPQGRLKKLPWVRVGITFAPRLGGPAKIIRKEADRLSSGLVLGVSPAPCKAWLSGDADIRPLVPRRPENFADAELRVKLGTAPFGSPKKAGATSDPRYGWSVNRTESDNRLTRFTQAQVGRSGLNGWGCLRLKHAGTPLNPQWAKEQMR